MVTPLIDILSEREMSSGWEFEAAIIAPDGQLVRIEVRMAFVDYNVWSPDGSATPSSVAEAVIATALAETSATSLPAIFDASTLRRWIPEADRLITSRVGQQ